MAVKISRVNPMSVCALKGITAGDELLKINGNEIMDVLDYDFYMTEQNLTLTFKCLDGKYKVVKTNSANCGLEFETYLMDKQQHCKNKCVFCRIY